MMTRDRTITIVAVLAYTIICLLFVQQCSRKTIPPERPPEPNETLDVTYVGSELWTDIWDIAVQENYTYCAMDYGLEILDISNPAHPAVAGKVFLPCGAYFLAVDGEYAFVQSMNHLSIVDVSSPEEAQVIAGLDTPCDGGIIVRDGYVYISSGAGLTVINAINPAAPLVVKTIPGAFGDIVCEDNYLYLAGYPGLTIIDITIPQSPVSLGSMSIDHAQSLAANGNVVAVWSAYCAPEAPGPCWSLTSIIDVGDPAAPVLSGIYPPGGYDSWKFRMDLAFVNDYLVQSASGSLAIIDLTDSHDASLVGTYGPPSMGGEATGLAVSGDNVLVPGLKIISLANPASPALVGSYSMPGANSLAVAGQYAYVATGTGLQVVEILDPYNPIPRGSVTPPSGGGMAVDIQGNYAYMATIGFEVIDVSNPDAPAIIGSCATPFGPRAVKIRDNYAYVADGNAGLLIIDIADPQSPEIVHSVTDLGEVTDVAVAGEYAYLTSFYGKLMVVDIADPLQSSVAGELYLGGEMWSVDIQGPYAYLANDFAGLAVVDVSNPTTPVLVSTFDTDWEAMNVTVMGNYTYVADSWYRCHGGGLEIIDISDPHEPFRAGHYTAPGWARGVAAADDYVYMVDISGLLVLQVQPK